MKRHAPQINEETENLKKFSLKIEPQNSVAIDKIPKGSKSKFINDAIEYFLRKNSWRHAIYDMDEGFSIIEDFLMEKNGENIIKIEQYKNDGCIHVYIKSVSAEFITVINDFCEKRNYLLDVILPGDTNALILEFQRRF